MRLIASLLALTLTSSHLSAAELTETWGSARALGMGNAYSAVVTGTDSLFYNPAGLGRNLSFTWSMFDPRIGINGTEAIESIQEIGDAGDDFASMVDGLYGKRLWGTAGLKSAVQLGNFAAAGFGSADVSALLANRADPVFNLNYFIDYGLAVGAGISAGGVFSLGIAARRITRTGTAAPLTAADLANAVEDSDAFAESLKHSGVGYGLDLGTVFAIPGPVSPAFSLVWRNIGTTQFRASGNDTAPQRIDSEIVLGAAVDIDLPLISITPAFDFRHLNRDDVQTGKKIHLGVEVGLPLIDLRVGLNQGYYTAGAGFNTGILRVEGVTYGVELGEYPGQLEDRRYLVQVAVELGFDFGGMGGGSGGSSGGSSSSGGGSRVRVKQRR